MLHMLRRKFVMISMLSFSVFLLLISLGYVASSYVSMEKAADSVLSALLDGFPQQPAEEPSPPVNAFGYQLEGSAGVALRSFVATIGTDGSIARIDNGIGFTISEETAAELAKQAAGGGKSSGKLGSYKYLRREAQGGERIAFVDITIQAQMLRQSLLSLAGINIAAFLLMLIIVLLVSRRAIRPIAENLEKQQCFIADAGHEIKTPLAIIQSNADAMELCIGGNKWLDNIRAQVKRLDGLTRDLLTMAGESKAPTAMAAVDWSALLENCLRDHEELFLSHGLTVKAEIAPAITVNGNCELLLRMTNVLADNAVQYAAEGSAVKVSLSAAGRNAVLEMSNKCNSLPKVRPDRLFDRFYRADEARTQRTGGYGIGLAIAKSVAQRHNGNIHAFFDDTQTIRFRAEIPLQSADGK